MKVLRIVENEHSTESSSIVSAPDLEGHSNAILHQHSYEHQRPVSGHSASSSSRKSKPHIMTKAHSSGSAYSRNRSYSQASSNYEDELRAIVEELPPPDVSAVSIIADIQESNKKPFQHNRRGSGGNLPTHSSVGTPVKNWISDRISNKERSTPKEAGLGALPIGDPTTADPSAATSMLATPSKDNLTKMKGFHNDEARSRFGLK